MRFIAIGRISPIIVITSTKSGAAVFFERVKVSKTVQTPAVSLSLINFYANLRERNTYLRSFPV